MTVPFNVASALATMVGFGLMPTEDAKRLARELDVPELELTQAAKDRLAAADAKRARRAVRRAAVA